MSSSIDDRIGRDLHDRATRGEILSSDERAALVRWYALVDEEEATREAEVTPESLADARADLDRARAELAEKEERVQALAARNESLRREIADLNERLASLRHP